MIETVRLEGVLARYTELRELPARSSRAAFGEALWVAAPAGQVMFDAGEPTPPYALLVEGRARVTYPTRCGSELFLYYLEPGGLCAMTTLALLTGTPSRVRATAESAVRGVGLTGAGFRRLLDDGEAFRRKVFDALSQRVDALLELIEEAATLDLSARLARRLLAGAPPIAATHQELAEGLGCSRERVSRLLERFQSAGHVRLGRGSIEVVDAAALRRTGEPED